MKTDNLTFKFFFLTDYGSKKRVERYKRKLTMLKMKKKTDNNSAQNTAQKIED